MGEQTTQGAREGRTGENSPEYADDEEVEIEMALLSLLAARDVGDPTEPVDLAALSPTEKQVLLQMMRQNIGFVEPPRAVTRDNEKPDARADKGTP